MTLSFYRSRKLDAAGFPIHGFSQAKGGVSRGAFESLNLAYNVGDDESNVARNLEIFEEAVCAGSKMPLARVKQVHGNKVAIASQVILDNWTFEPTVEADAIVTAEKTVLAIQTADCAAVLMADPESRVVAAVHAGWRGTASGVIRNALRAMAELGAEPHRLIAAIGPHICQNCYEVGEDVAMRFPESIDPCPGRPGKFLLDLANAIEVSLIVAGVSSSRIERDPQCTSCEKESLFSFRRSSGKSGRMLGFISNCNI